MKFFGIDLLLFSLILAYLYSDKILDYNLGLICMISGVSYQLLLFHFFPIYYAICWKLFLLMLLSTRIKHYYSDKIGNVTVLNYKFSFYLFIFFIILFWKNFT